MFVNELNEIELVLPTIRSLQMYLLLLHQIVDSSGITQFPSSIETSPQRNNSCIRLLSVSGSRKKKSISMFFLSANHRKRSSI